MFSVTFYPLKPYYGLNRVYVLSFYKRIFQEIPYNSSLTNRHIKPKLCGWWFRAPRDLHCFTDDPQGPKYDSIETNLFVFSPYPAIEPAAKPYLTRSDKFLIE